MQRLEMGLRSTTANQCCTSGNVTCSCNVQAATSKLPHTLKLPSTLRSASWEEPHVFSLVLTTNR